MRKVLLPLFLATILATPAALLGQNATTSLRGVVKDPSGAVISGATITLHNEATGQTITASSAKTGEFQVAQIPPATYTVTVHAAGFGDQSKVAELLVSQPATINFGLTLQSSKEVIDVSATAATLNQTDASLGGSFDNSTIQSLPSETRNIPDLLSLQPGVFFLPAPANPSAQDSRSGSVNGGRSDQGNITLDGVDDNDQVNGFAFTGVLRQTQDSIEEFRVTTGNANADAGRSSGAQVSLVTKSGTNKFHGAAYEYNRPTNTVSNDFFNKQAQLNSKLQNRPGKLIRNIFGADLGGPILKDKVFFFANYEGSRQAESAEVTRTVPTALYQSGILQYKISATGSQSITPAQLAMLDGGCTVCNTAAYTPGPGADPNSLSYVKLMPEANGTATGDGLNTGSYAFSSPNPKSQNTTIVRLDYDPTSRQRIFVRGNLQKDTTGSVQQFPGQGPSSSLIDNSKGITVGHTWTLTQSLVNDLRYGYIRQGYGESGVGVGDYVDFRFISTATAETRNTIISNPVNNVIDNLNWSKGKHNIQLGGNWRLVHQNRASDSNSYNSATSNPSRLGGSAPNPTSIGLPAIVGFSTSYSRAYANLVGTIPQVTNVYNYKVSGPTSGSLLADGASIARHFKANEFEYYLQDSWRVRPNLTLTFGVRHTILQTPYETAGQQVTPTIDTHAWFTQREVAALQGKIYEPDITFAPSGKSYGKPGFWPKAKNNFAPRFAVAYSPNSKTSIRAGAGIYYDHYGQGLVNTFDQNGSAGLASQVSNPAGVNTYKTSPRFVGRHTLPFSNGTAPATTAFPFTPQLGNFAITWGIDSRLKTPYSEAFDLSFQRQLPGSFTFEAAYVGRLGRHLLQSLDLTEPVDLVDTKSGSDYYKAAAQIGQAVDINGGNPNATIAKIPYFEDVFPFMAGVDYVGESATQAIYTNEWAPYRVGLGATTALSDIDFYCGYGCPANYQPQFWQDQFASLYALSTIGISSYHSAQLTLRHPMSKGLQADINYTYSRSIDMGSDAERSTEFSNGVATAASEIINTWKPKLNRGISDFNATHVLTVDWVYQLPVGKGRHYLNSTNGFVDALLGGWQLSGLARNTSGLPFSLREPGWSTDWQITGYGIKTGNVQVQKHFDTAGNIQYFSNAAAINNGVNTGGPVRIPYAGEVGQRNNYIGDGYFDIDSGLTKAWRLGDYGGLKFGWEVYNVTNTNRFDPQSISSQLTGGSLGIANALLTQPRRMQFSLRYDF